MDSTDSLKLVLYIYVKGSDGEIKMEKSFHPSVHTQMHTNSLGWARTKTGIWNSMRVSLVKDSALTP